MLSPFGSHLFVSQTLPDDALQRALGALLVVYAQLDAMTIPEVELG
jgi:hypothetical protein